MRTSKLGLLGAVALFVFTGVAGVAQVVISTQAGLINHTQGGVRLNDQAVESRRGQFQQMRQQDVLSTIHGRAEVLLNPGVFMRLGENSAFRLVSSQITDARVALVSGTAIVEANEVNRDTAVTLSCQQAEVSILKRGVYRLDANPPTVRVFEGKVLVRSAGQSDGDRQRKGACPGWDVGPRQVRPQTGRLARPVEPGPCCLPGGPEPVDGTVAPHSGGARQDQRVGVQSLLRRLHVHAGQRLLLQLVRLLLL